MSQPKSPDPAKLIVSVLTREKEIFPKVLDQLQTLFGPVEHQSGWLNFDFTSYYEKEMGNTKKGFRALEWTYPDYQSQEILEFLTKIRSQYATQVKRIKKDFP